MDRCSQAGRLTRAGALSLCLAACGSPAADGDITDDEGADEQPSTPMDQTPEPEATAIDPAAIFNLKCAPCHGEDLTGAPGGIDLTERLPQLNDDQALESIKNGVSPGMPAWADSLSDEEISELIDYLRERID